MYYYHPYLQTPKLPFKGPKCYAVSWSKLKLWTLSFSPLHPEVTHSFVSLPSNTKTLFQVWFVQKMTGSSEDMGNRNTEALLMEMELGKLVASPTTWSSNTTLGIYSEELKGGILRNIYTPTFVAAALIAIVQTVKATPDPQMKEWINETWHTCATEQMPWNTCHRMLFSL